MWVTWEINVFTPLGFCTLKLILIFSDWEKVLPSEEHEKLSLSCPKPVVRHFEQVLSEQSKNLVEKSKRRFND